MQRGTFKNYFLQDPFWLQSLKDIKKIAGDRF